MVNAVHELLEQHMDDIQPDELDKLLKDVQLCALHSTAFSVKLTKTQREGELQEAQAVVGEVRHKMEPLKYHNCARDHQGLQGRP